MDRNFAFGLMPACGHLRGAPAPHETASGTLILSALRRTRPAQLHLMRTWLRRLAGLPVFLPWCCRQPRRSERLLDRIASMLPAHAARTRMRAGDSVQVEDANQITLQTESNLSHRPRVTDSRRLKHNGLITIYCFLWGESSPILWVMGLRHSRLPVMQIVNLKQIGRHQ
jgi:hypothetical protein